MIHYIELVPTREAAKVGCTVEVKVPVASIYRKLMVKNNSHIRLYYEAEPFTPGFQETPCKVMKFFLAPTGVECPEVTNFPATYLDSVELYADTVVFHIYHLN